MTEQEELIKSLEKEIRDCEELLKVTKSLDDAVPKIQERIREAEAKLLLLKQVPPDYVEEMGPKYFPFQFDEENTLAKLVSEVRVVADPLLDYFDTTSGTTSAYDEAYHELNSNNNWRKPTDWPFVVDAFTNLAEYKAHKADIPSKLEKLNKELGKAFTTALGSIEKARGKIVGVDVATNHMRDIVQQIWGGLVNQARQKIQKQLPSDVLNQQIARNAVANILCNDAHQERKLITVLDNLKVLHCELSVTRLTKNPLSDNILKMNELYERWILQIDDLVNILEM